MKLKNPILPGFYPDPSICRRGEDYYLVTSTFEYYPGIPVFHSRDLVHWEQIGHVLDRPEQLALDGLNPSRGIYASSIFYHEGRFYVITTLVGNAPYWDNVNFYVWADDPAGPWSDPIIVQGAEGIDPSLVFDEGKVYYLGNCRPYPDTDSTARHIWMQELELSTGRLLGERHTLLTGGAMTNASAPEGPHIYHIGDYYYLLIAEGGTSHYHSSTIFRSRSLTGPYEGNPRNPLITHRNLRWDYPVHSTGHADMIQLANGEWWAVLLASRPVGGDYRTLGRETFCVPVRWEDDWPVFCPDTGRVEMCYQALDLPAHPWPERPVCCQFESDRLGAEWVTVRTPRRKFYSLTERAGYLRLYPGPETLRETSHSAFLGRRQQHMQYAVRTVLEWDPQEQEESGVVLLMNHRFHFRFVYGQWEGQKKIRLIRCFDGREEILAEKMWNAGKTYLRVTAHLQDLAFYVGKEEEVWELVADHVSGTLLSKEIAGGFTGTVLGLYASANGQESQNTADFDWFEYQPLGE